MSGRVTGYHYEVGDDGRKHRVYGKGTKAPRRKKGAGASSYAKGRGGYRRSYASRAPAAAGTSVVYPNVFRGSGGYYNSSFVKSMRAALPEGSFSKAGSMVAGPLGSWAGNMLSKIAGFGDYQVTSNSLIGEGQSPAVMHSDSGSTIVRHREYIMDVVSSEAGGNLFVNQSLPIQPGLNSAFPWLAPIAQQFEQYTIRGMVYEFKTLYADAIASSAANSSLGGVIMATDYNVLNPPFTTKQQMDNTQYTTSCKPSVSFYHPIECKPGSMPTNQLFIRSGAPPNTGDLRLYDLGQFQIASFGIASTGVVLGELWCSYEIEFSKPINNGATANVLSDHIQLKSVTNGTPLGTTSVAVNGSSIGGSIVSGQAYVFPEDVTEGNFLFAVSWAGSSTASVSTPSLTLNNCALLTVYNNDASTSATSTVGTQSIAMMSFVIQINTDLGPGPGVAASVAFSGAGVLPASVTGADLFVTEIDSDIVT